MKTVVFLLVACALSVVCAAPGPVVLESPVGTSSRTWVEDGVTFLEVVNETDRALVGTVTLNEIYEKVFVVWGNGSAEIDGRWIEIELSPKVRLTVRLGK